MLFTFIAITQCNSDKKIIGFQNQEEQKIVNNIDQFLKFMDYTNYKIISTIHGNLSGDITSKKIITESFNGYDYNPEGPDGIQDTNLPPTYNPGNNGHSTYDRREFNGTYETPEKIRYDFDYISILIVFEKINQKEIESLKEIIQGSFLNRNRGDTLIITSKK